MSQLTISGLAADAGGEVAELLQKQPSISNDLHLTAQARALECGGARKRTTSLRKMTTSLRPDTGVGIHLRLQSIQLDIMWLIGKTFTCK